MKKERVINHTLLFVLIICLYSLPGCRDVAENKLVDQEQQKAMSPNQVLQDLIAGNKRFYSNALVKRDSLIDLSEKASIQGQFPKAVILACMDSRSIPEIIFDQSIADIFTLRVAGNVVSEDMLGSMEYATKYAGAKLIVILGHTNCGAVKAACQGVVSGNITPLLENIKPSVFAVGNEYNTGKLDCESSEVLKKIARKNVLNMIKRVVEKSETIRRLVENKTVAIVGGMHDLKSGIVTFEKV